VQVEERRNARMLEGRHKAETRDLEKAPPPSFHQLPPLARKQKIKYRFLKFEIPFLSPLPPLPTRPRCQFFSLRALI
jgi:hypothetical protein